MKKFKIFEKGVESLIEADNVVTMMDGNTRVYKDKRLIASLGKDVSWIEIGETEDEKED